MVHMPGMTAPASSVPVRLSPTRQVPGLEGCTRHSCGEPRSPPGASCDVTRTMPRPRLCRAAVVLLSGLARPARRPTRRPCLRHVVSQPRPAAPTPPGHPTDRRRHLRRNDHETEAGREPNPDHDKGSVSNGLTMRTATATNHLWARNTLTHRIQGLTTTATIQLDFTTICDGQQPEHHRHRSRERQRHGRPHPAARGRRHPPRHLPSGNLLLQHRRHQLHPPGARVHHGQHLAVLHGLPLRPFQPRHADTRRLRPHRTVRADNTPSAATFLLRI